MFLVKCVLKICSKFTGEHPYQSAISIKLLCDFIETILWHGCSPVNLLDIFRTPSTRNTSGWLLLESYDKLLDVEIDNKLNFEKRISNICKKTSNQPKAICRLQTFVGHKEEKAIMNTFALLSFNYGCLIWHFISKKSQNKDERIYERNLNFLSNDYLSSYAKLLEKSTSVSMETKTL